MYSPSTPRSPSFASKHVIQLDCIMGGREMTEQDFKTLAKAAGFQGFKVVCSAFNTYIMDLASKHVIQLDCIMLTTTSGGREMTEQDFKTLAKAAGFQGFKVVCSAFNTYIMEFLKKP
ncbi:hypothetical protein CUMW_196560 [Citrus unshiu]|uniref:O-methyltransferase domain-containing protein n=1 Tax=Citrus unshiu TaxID=55188 RepID=A0A2H5Q524_CITUN|nr:hypothetical protein CUMW_196560 [Citrus unshiu]